MLPRSRRLRPPERVDQPVNRRQLNRPRPSEPPVSQSRHPQRRCLPGPEPGGRGRPQPPPRPLGRRPQPRELPGPMRRRPPPPLLMGLRQVPPPAPVPPALPHRWRHLRRRSPALVAAGHPRDAPRCRSSRLPAMPLPARRTTLRQPWHNGWPGQRLPWQPGSPLPLPVVHLLLPPVVPGAGGVQFQPHWTLRQGTGPEANRLQPARQRLSFIRKPPPYRGRTPLTPRGLLEARRLPAPPGPRRTLMPQADRGVAGGGGPAEPSPGRACREPRMEPLRTRSPPRGTRTPASSPGRTPWATPRGQETPPPAPGPAKAHGAGAGAGVAPERHWLGIRRLWHRKGTKCSPRGLPLFGSKSPRWPPPVRRWRLALKALMPRSALRLGAGGDARTMRPLSRQVSLPMRPRPYPSLRARPLTAVKLRNLLLPAAGGAGVDRAVRMDPRPAPA